MRWLFQRLIAVSWFVLLTPGFSKATGPVPLCPSGTVEALLMSSGREQVEAKIQKGAHGYLFDGHPAEFRDPHHEAAGETSGALNDGIFFYIADDGSERAVKLTRDMRRQKGWEEIPFDFAGAHDSEAQGYRNGAELGGPKVYREGTARLDGREVRWVEMERLRDFEEIHDVLKKGDPRILLEKGEGGRTPLEQMAKLFVDAFKQGKTPDDASFALIMKTRKVRWFDTAQMKKTDHPSPDDYESMGMTVEIPVVQGMSSPILQKAYFEAYFRELKHAGPPLTLQAEHAILEGAFSKGKDPRKARDRESKELLAAFATEPGDERRSAYEIALRVFDSF